MTGLHFLTADPTSFAGVPGVWRTDSAGVHVDLDETETVTLEGRPIFGHHDFGVLAERSGVVVESGDVHIEVAKRGGFDILRPRDPANPRRAAFSGSTAFPADPDWVVPALFAPFIKPRPTTVGAAVEGLEHVYDAVGELTFTRAGKTLSLVAFPGHTDGELLVLFTDETAGVTTYPAVRSLSVPAPDADGEVRLDFNRASNLPCAHTPYATCPLPPIENRLPIAVTAGELDPSLDAEIVERIAG
ncbi:DUF1684 domain-containing protein [Flexivirga endophytica]|uniref:DUF1684 domain-containing protein n=1 Tax=Flexivirga endophytica TaxID=1849103 RepID=UPI001E565523|nr:DUF1684 domain-containing protein [Flexivirga endophytica]